MATQALSAQDIVLVTGANGHVAQHVVQQLLSATHGPKVKASIRSSSSAQQVSSVFQKDIDSGRLELVTVADITDPKKFSEAIKGVTHVAHIASPLPSDDASKSIEEGLLKPAREGTLAVMKAASEVDSVKSIVITGSFVNCLDVEKFRRPGYTYTADDWCPLTEDDVYDLDKFDPIMKPYVAYIASKIFAEKAAWDYVKTNKPHYKVSVILPTWIGGPYLLPVKKIPDSYSLSNKIIYGGLSEAKPGPTDFAYWVDVRDVARAHIAALERSDVTNGKRYLVRGEKKSRSELQILAKKAANRELGKDDIVVEEEMYDADGTPALQVLGLGSYISIEKTVNDLIKQALGQNA